MLVKMVTYENLGDRETNERPQLLLPLHTTQYTRVKCTQPTY